MVHVEKNQSYLFEAKLNDDKVSKNFEVFSAQLGPAYKQVQLVAYLDRRYDTPSGISVENGLQYLENLNLLKN